MLKDFDISAIIDLDSARDAIVKLLNLIEVLQQENQELKHLNQLLRDELRRLNGEQGKPDIKPSRKDTGDKNVSSEKERKERKKRNKKSKKDRIKIHNKRICKVDPDILPEDAKFKGYQPVTVQDVIFKASNTLFLKEKYHSPSLNSTPWQNIDDTSTRVNGQNQFCHIVCNPFYTAYFTTPNKTRLA